MRVRPRLLKRRVFVVLSALVAVHLAATVIIGLLVIQPSFDRLDRTEALANLRRCVDGIDREVYHVSSFCADWATWDDTYKFVADKNKDYVRANLIPESLENTSRINLLFIVDLRGRVQAGIVHDRELGGMLHVPEFPETRWPADHPLLRHAALDSEIRGVVMTQAGPVLLVSRPIVTSLAKGPARGTLIAGRFLDDEIMAGLQRDLHLDFTVRNLRRDELSPEERKAEAALPGAPKGILQPMGKDRQRAYALISDVAGQPALLMKLDLPRGILAQGRSAMRYALASNAVAAVLLLTAIYWLMQRFVLARVAALQRGVVAIGDSGDLSLRVPVHGADELTALATRLNQMLEHIEMLEQPMRLGQQMAEHANQLKSRFLSNVSHEIRTPMNGIMGYCEAIQRTPSLDTARRHAGIILRESNLLLMLVNDLLDMARIESGRLALERVHVDLTQLVDEIGQTIGMLAQARNLDFVATVAPDVPRWVWGDPLRLHQILVNLGSNAVKFTEHGQVRLTVELPTECESPRLLFSVIDTGIGIPPEKHGDIFDAFLQVDPSTTRKYGGTGLGLAIVRQLVCLMGGRLHVKSDLGEGSTFSFWMPLEPAPAPETGAAGGASGEPDTDHATRSGRILLADDHPTNQEIASLFLVDAGHQVTVVSNGREAVEACQRERFDLVILDVQMPVMDGLEAVTHIRRDAACPPVIALTASADIETCDKCLQAGFRAVITKPIRRATLVNTVSRWLDDASASTEHRSDDRPSPGASESAGPGPPIDLEVAAREFGGQEVLNRVLTTFLGRAAEQIAELRGALAQHDRTALHLLAHAVKGAAATLEAVPLAAAAAALDSASAAGDPEELERGVEEVAAELERLVRYVETSGGCVRIAENVQPCRG